MGVEGLSVNSSHLISSYEWAADECLPACNGYSFHQESIQSQGCDAVSRGMTQSHPIENPFQYIKVGDRFIQAMREDLDIAQSIAITSMVLSLAEQVSYLR